jgi:hypothetical protein
MLPSELAPPATYPVSRFAAECNTIGIISSLDS